MPTRYMLCAEDMWQQISVAIGAQPGIYRVHCVAEGGGDFVPINRLLGTDQQGILYIGSGKELRGRVADLRRAVSSACGEQGYAYVDAHQCEPKYASQEIRARFPYARLCVTLEPAPTAEAADEEEILALEEYERLFGEAPPFNEGRPRARWRADNPPMQPTGSAGG